MGKAEHIIENHLIKLAKKYDCMCFKFTSPSNAGVPDRIIIKNDTYFVELKAPEEKPRKLQLKVMQDMKNHGANVYVLSTKEEVENFFANIILKEKK